MDSSGLASLSPVVDASGAAAPALVRLPSSLPSAAAAKDEVVSALAATAAAVSDTAAALALAAPAAVPSAREEETTKSALQIPAGLQEALFGLAREALRHQPEDVVEFSRW